MSSSYNTIDSSPGKWTGRIFVNNISHVVEEILRKKQALTTTRGLDVSDGEDGTLKIQLANYLDKSRNSREAAVIAIGKWFARHNMSFTTAPDGYEAHLRSTLDKFFNGTDTEYCHEVTRQFDSDSDRMGWVFNQRPAVCSNRRLIGLLAQWFRPLPLKGTVISSQCWLVGLVTD
ncbi:hypothetical protein M231_00763 [Tremella mesenterica]|uniref:Uncharacterized protein n=1 Tax=Tremella mesenterica TaxID=5217 RepID=A0A4Q1BV64_TREME|nr:hypothetical protein M231_00763 [Tremella mesenterica]